MAGNKVLVADDEIHIIQVVAIKLRNNGFEVITAENGQRAYDLAVEHRPDVIITDYQMPLMTGVEFVEKLRACPEHADTPVIMLTARGFAVEDERRHELNIAVCLSKPFSPRELLENVQFLLEQKTVA